MIQPAYRVETSRNEGESVSGRQMNYMRAGWMEHTLSVDPPFVSVRHFQLIVAFTLRDSTGHYES
jgi:hypothetical protein